MLDLRGVLFGGLLVLVAAMTSNAQSSSLYLEQEQAELRPALSTYQGRTVEDPLAPAIAQSSMMAVTLPEPRQFAVHDLVFIVVRESSQSKFDGSLETDTSSELDGEVTSFPTMTLADLLQLQFQSRDLGSDNPKVGIEFERSFQGEGEQTRNETMTARLTARVIDIRPNGNLILEARKHMQTDDESVTLSLTGTCRPEDIDSDNTLESYKIYDLHLYKITDGEIRQASQKGLLTKLFDLIFNF